MDDVIRRIEQEAGIPGLASVLAQRLPASDLHSLLLEVYRRRAGDRSGANVLADYVSSRFVHPGRTDPRLLLQWDAAAFSALPDGFIPLELSPLSPLGTNSVVATVSQNKTVVTARNLEVVSDATNVLALECAVRRRALLSAAPHSAELVRLAASHRVVRPQFSGNATMLPHFRLFSLCSAGRDTGANSFEREGLAEHVRFYVKALSAFLGEAVPLRVSVTDLASDSPRDWWEAAVLAPLRYPLPRVEFGFDQSRTAGRGYYVGVCFHVFAVVAGSAIELADGGDVNWTQKLLNNAKERLFISGIGSERVCGLKQG